MGVKWRQTIMGLTIDDDSSLYIVDAPTIGGIAKGSFERGWLLVSRHTPVMRSVRVSGPFPTLDAAKAAYIVLAPRYPGP